MSVAGNEGGNHEIISQSELLRATKLELNVLLRRIAAELPSLPKGAGELPDSGRAKPLKTRYM